MMWMTIPALIFAGIAWTLWRGTIQPCIHLVRRYGLRTGLRFYWYVSQDVGGDADWDGDWDAAVARVTSHIPGSMTVNRR